jgi:hypothetical protein
MFLFLVLHLNSCLKIQRIGLILIKAHLFASQNDLFKIAIRSMYFRRLVSILAGGLLVDYSFVHFDAYRLAHAHSCMRAHTHRV